MIYAILDINIGPESLCVNILGDGRMRARTALLKYVRVNAKWRSVDQRIDVMTQDYIASMKETESCQAVSVQCSYSQRPISQQSQRDWRRATSEGLEVQSLRRLPTFQSWGGLRSPKHQGWRESLSTKRPEVPDCGRGCWIRGIGKARRIVCEAWFVCRAAIVCLWTVPSGLRFLYIQSISSRLLSLGQPKQA